MTMSKSVTFLLVLATAGLLALMITSLAFAEKTDGAGKQSGKNPAVTSLSGNTPPNTYPGNKPDAPKKSDKEIRTEVQQVLKGHKDVSVAVDKAVVTLSGQVASEADQKAAIRAARDIAGVHTVRDQMQVTGSGSQSVGEYLDDAGITAAVKSELLKEKGLSSFKISADTIDGVVTLTGNVKSRELADKAGDLAERVKGVKRVDNKLLVQP